jgi:hypothetical protein
MQFFKESFFDNAGNNRGGFAGCGIGVFQSGEAGFHQNKSNDIPANNPASPRPRI